jgi:hypothetical protein
MSPNMIQKDALIEITYDAEKGKLRAQAPDGSWIRFPNDLRSRGAIYLADLKPGKSGSWIVTGPIRPFKE